MPEWMRIPGYRRLRSAFRSYQQRRALRALTRERIRRIVIGSGGIESEGWVSTDQDILNLLHESAWASLLQTESLDAILAEHVWEHLSPDEAIAAGKTCFRYLKPGGRLRVAVPDGLHPDPVYVERVRPGGSGPGADDHKVLYTYAAFRDLFEEIGFDVVLYEYFDESGRFHFRDWDAADGLIRRSKRYDPRNSGDRLAYTSIVLDAVKPAPAA